MHCSSRTIEGGVKNCPILRVRLKTMCSAKKRLTPKQLLLFVVSTALGPFIYYVSTFLGFLDLPPSIYISLFLVLKISKNCHFLTPLPPYKFLRNICMVPLRCAALECPQFWSRLFQDFFQFMFLN